VTTTLAFRMLSDKWECFLNTYSGHFCYLWFTCSHAKICSVATGLLL